MLAHAIAPRISFVPFISTEGRHWGTQRMPPPPIVLGYCSQLSIKLKIQDGARRRLGDFVTYEYVKVN